ncbi:MAG: HPr family phosphocarrier protein [Acidobacteria bacterium]|nr:HPr family phosphocarrier protein [Acidobacteriota bacterium]
MLEGSIRVVNRLGLHARAAAQLVKLAGRFKSRIILKRLDKEVEANAKSMLSVLALAASFNTILSLTVEGKDEAEAFAAVERLFNSRFGENE